MWRNCLRAKLEGTREKSKILGQKSQDEKPVVCYPKIFCAVISEEEGTEVERESNGDRTTTMKSIRYLNLFEVKEI